MYEIILCLDVIDTNGTFSATHNGNDKHRIMFTDSAIAKAYSQKSSKVKNIILKKHLKLKKKCQQISQERDFLSNLKKQAQVKQKSSMMHMLPFIHNKDPALLHYGITWVLCLLGNVSLMICLLNSIQ